MVCIYCGSKTEVVNSRAQKRRNQTWRRRHCFSCDIVLTSTEAYDLSQSIVVRDSQGRTMCFSRDILFASLLAALGHRRAPVSDSSALTDTVIARLLPLLQGGVLTTDTVTAIALETLEAFDGAAAVYYRAYHPGGTGTSD